MKIRCYNPPTDELELTYLSAALDRGDTALAVKNNQRFAASAKVLIGRMGFERTEIRTVASITDQRTVTVDALQFAHNADDPIYILDYDKINIYRATAEDGSYSLIDTVDIDVDNADLQTPYEDVSGLTTHWYKISHYNSVSLEESDYSDPVQAEGYPENSVGKLVDEVVNRVRDVSFSVLDMNDYISVGNAVNKDLRTQSHKPYVWQKDHEDLSPIAGQNYVDLPERMQSFDYAMFSYSTGGQVQKCRIDPMPFDDWTQAYDRTQGAASDFLNAIAIDEETKRLYLYPTPSTNQSATLRVHFYRKIPTITGPGDLFITPDDLVYRYAFMAEHYMAKSESDKQYAPLAATYDNKYGNQVVKLQRANRLDVGTQRSFQKVRVPGYRRRYTL